MLSNMLLSFNAIETVALPTSAQWKKTKTEKRRSQLVTSALLEKLHTKCLGEAFQWNLYCIESFSTVATPSKVHELLSTRKKINYTVKFNSN